MTKDRIKIWHDSETSGWVKAVFDNIDYCRTDNLDNADYILIPDTFTTNFHEKNLDWLKQIYEKSIETNKPYVAFLHDDPEWPMQQNGINYTDNGILFRTSFNKSQSSLNEYTLPSFDRNTQFPISPIGQKGIHIGFCGALTHPIRYDCVLALNSNSEIIKKMHLRQNFHMHFSKEQQVVNEQQFIETIASCTYQLCNRGAGNFSHRFYETMMFGRIPVIVNTDMLLPCSDEIDWENTIVIANSAKELPGKLIEWHNSHDSIERQANCRSIWEKHLSAKGFASHVEKILSR